MNPNILLLSFLLVFSLFSTAQESEYANPIPYGEFFIGEKDGKKVFLNQELKPHLTSLFDEIYETYSSDYILVKEQGILKRYDLKTAKQTDLKPDSVLHLGTVKIVNFGGNWTEEFERFQSSVYVGLLWFFLDEATDRIIGKPYFSLGVFNEAGHVIANPVGKDYFVALNSKGEELKPNHHLVNHSLYTGLIKDTIFDTLVFHLKRAGLLQQVQPSNYQKYISENYVFEFYEVIYYTMDELEELLMVSFNVFDKKSYHSLLTPFPSEPKYEFNFGDFYRVLSEENEAGYRWVVPLHIDHDLYYYFEGNEKFQLNYAILVDRFGKEVVKANYQPLESTPFLDKVMTHLADWKHVESMQPIIEELKASFPSAKGLSNSEFLARYTDSVYTEVIELSYFDGENENPYFHHSFFKRNGLQRYPFPPPMNVQYEFFPTDFNQVKGWKGYRQHDLQSKFYIGSKRAYTFGTRSHFVFPNQVDGYTTYQIKGQYQHTQDTSMMRTLATLPFYTELIQTGRAQLSYYGDQGYLTSEEDLSTFDYVDRIGLLYENELLLPPVYYFIALDESNESQTGFVLIDSLYQVHWYGVKDRICKPLTDYEFRKATSTHLIVQNRTSNLYSLYPLGMTDFDQHWYQIRGAYQYDTNIKNFLVLKDPISQDPLIAENGEDSVIFNPDGTITMVYAPKDTVYIGPYSVFPDNFYLELYEKSSGQVFDNAKQIQPEVKANPHGTNGVFRLNYLGERNFTMKLLTDRIQFSNDAGKLLELSLDAYHQVMRQAPSENGFGGVFVEGKYIPYNSLEAFPEEHAIYIQVAPNYWLLGKKNKLELVQFETGSILRRFSWKFKSHVDFVKQMGINAELRQLVSY